MITFRLGLFQLDRARAKELIEAIRRTPGSCDTVWLTTMGYYPSLERHVGYADGWVEVAEMFREAGIGVSLQVANTLGHTDFPQAAPENGGEFARGMMNAKDDPFIVGPRGQKNKACFCWNSESIREYISSVIRIYCERIHPDRLWLDDDLRAHNHNPSWHACFCDRCIAKFNAQQGTHFTREELVREINYGDPRWRKKYVDFCRQGLYDFTYAIASAGVAASKDLAFGYEYAHQQNYMGTDDHHILRALHDASGKAVETRPGGGFYDDKSPWLQYVKAMELAAANATLPDYVQNSIAEIEDLPGTVFGKSIGGIINEGTVDLAMGCTGLSFTDVQSCHESMGYYEKIFARFSHVRPYWERLSEVSKKHCRGGVNIYMGEQPYLRRMRAGEKEFSWTNFVNEDQINWLRRGLPITFDRRKPSAYLLHHLSVDAMTDEDIRFLLTQPVVTDGETVQKLIERGFGKHFAFTPEVAGDDTMEVFTPGPINEGHQGDFYNENRYASVPMQRFIFRDLDGRSEVVGQMYNSHFLTDEALLGPCSLVTQIVRDDDLCAKWFISGYSLWNDRVSAAKRDQIANALDAITAMPVKLVSVEQAVVIPSVDADGRTVSVTVAACSQNGTGPLQLLIRRPAGTQADAMATRHDTVPVTVSACGEDEICVTTGALDPYEVMTVFLA